MKITILTLFPKMFDALKESLIGKAINKGILQIDVVDFREFSLDKHKKVDDTPYGGGAGMVVRADVVYDAYQSVKEAYNAALSSSTEKDFVFVGGSSYVVADLLS